MLGRVELIPADVDQLRVNPFVDSAAIEGPVNYCL